MHFHLFIRAFNREKYIVQVSLGDTPFGTIEYKTIFAVGLLLFTITLAMNILSRLVLRRFREVYE